MIKWQKEVDFMERVLIVEDDENIRQLLKLTLASFNYELVDFENGKDAYDYLQNNKVDLAILDLMLPGMNGYDILKFIRSKATLKDLPVIILSAKDKELDKIMGLDLGADDYLTKPFDKSELLARIQAVVRRSKGHSNSIIRTGDVQIDLDTQTVTVNGKTLHLTGKEYGIMELLSLRKGATLNKDQFLNHLYGGIDEPELKIIDVFICKLRKKLERASGGKNYIETVWGRGYVLRDPDEAKGH